MGKYDDIIGLPHPISAKHPQMSMHDRAAQFAPFAALTGYEGVIREAGRLTDERIELEESARQELDGKLQMLYDLAEEQPQITVTYFRADEQKTGGAYVTAAGRVKKIRADERQIVLEGDRLIPVDDIFELESDLFRGVTF